MGQDMVKKLSSYGFTAKEIADEECVCLQRGEEMRERKEREETVIRE